MKKICDIFISYRRSDGRDIARTVQQALYANGYKDIFFDYSSLRDGIFNEHIIEAINQCNDFILILTAESLSRCSNHDDWVAREIETAIAVGCQFIPLVVDNTFEGFPDDFPKRLSIIRNIQQTKLLTDEYFEESIKRLLTRLTSKPSNIEQKKTLHLTISTDETSILYINGERRAKIKASKPISVEGIKGETYEIRLDSLAQKGDTILLSHKIIADESLTMSFHEKRELENKRKMVEKEQREKEKEHKRIMDVSLQTLLSNYDDCNMERDSPGWGKKDIIVTRQGKLGYVSPLAYELLPCKYDKVSDFIDGYACVVEKGICHMIDRNGNVILSNIGDDITVPYQGYLIVKRSEHYGVVDVTGITCLEICFDEICPTTEVGIFLVRLGMECWLHDAKTNKQLSQRYNDIIGFKSIGKNYYYSHQGFVDFHACCPITAPLRVKKNEKYGVIDLLGNILFPPTADNIELTESPSVLVNTSGKYGLFDTVAQKYSIPLVYDFLGFSWGHSNYLALVAATGKIKTDGWSFKSDNTSCNIGILNMGGKEIVPLIYAEIRMYDCYEDTEFNCLQQNMKQWDVYDINGNLKRTYP